MSPAAQKREPMAGVHFRIPVKVRKELRKQADALGQLEGEFIRNAIERHLSYLRRHPEALEATQ